MLYRSRGATPARTFITLIVLGMLVGVGFFTFDHLRLSQIIQPPGTPTAAPVAGLPTPPLTPMSAALAPLDPTDAPAASPVMGSVFIPSVGIYGEVITAIIRGNTWDVTHLGTYVGYLQGTAWLGQPGNVVLSGHVEMADGRQGVFAALGDVSVGDEVVLTANEQEHRYRVRETRSVQPDDLSVVQPTDTSVLTLITCADYNFLRNVYDTRLVVIAEPM